MTTAATAPPLPSLRSFDVDVGGAVVVFVFLVDVLEVLVTEDAVVVTVVVSSEQSPPVYPKTQLHPQFPVVPFTAPPLKQVMSFVSHASAVPQVVPK